VVDATDAGVGGPDGVDAMEDSAGLKEEMDDGTGGDPRSGSGEGSLPGAFREGVEL